MTTASTQTTTRTQPDILKLLSTNPVRAELVADLKDLKAACGTLPRPHVALILGQWYHPLHYFPTFLSRLISVTSELERQTFISRILWQELGEGDPRRAHEQIYLETIAEGEFEAGRVAGAAPSAATEALVAGYGKASEREVTGLGYLYGTEVVDLPMVSTVGELMRRCTGKRQLAWVNIHVQQEPEHVASSEATLQLKWGEGEAGQVLASAEELWRLWINFFQSIRQAVLQ